MIAGIATLILGVVIGYLGQRSRLCFISGYRDYILTRDTNLLKGVGGAFLGALGGFILFYFLKGNVPAFPMWLTTPLPGFNVDWLIAIFGGLAVGLVGVFSGGCPFRMHVLAAEGKKSYWFYLFGFYIGLVFYNLVTTRFMDLIRSLK